MHIRTVNIKIDEKIDNLFANTRNLGATEEKPELAYNYIVHVALPNIFKDEETAGSYVSSLKNYLLDKKYDSDSIYFLEVALSDELQPIWHLIDIYLKTFPDEKKTFDSLTDEILFQSLLDYCSYLYDEKIKEIGSEPIPRFFH